VTLRNLATRLLGLQQHNYYVDQVTYDGSGLRTGSRLRIYDNSTNVGTDVGVIGCYQMAANYGGGLLTDYQLAQCAEDIEWDSSSSTSSSTKISFSSSTDLGVSSSSSSRSSVSSTSD
jgi:hypothetical protein